MFEQHEQLSFALQDRDKWKQEAIYWRDIATQLYETCKEIAYQTLDPMMDYEQALKDTQP